MAVSFVLSIPVPRGQSGSSWLAFGRVGTGVQPLQGENYTYSRVLGYVHSYSSVTSSSLVLLYFYLSLVYFSARIAVEVREGSSRTDLGWVSEGVCDPESGMLEWPALRCFG